MFGWYFWEKAKPKIADPIEVSNPKIATPRDDPQAGLKITGTPHMPLQKGIPTIEEKKEDHKKRARPKLLKSVKHLFKDCDPDLHFLEEGLTPAERKPSGFHVIVVESNDPVYITHMRLKLLSPVESCQVFLTKDYTNAKKICSELEHESAVFHENKKWENKPGTRLAVWKIKRRDPIKCIVFKICMEKDHWQRSRFSLVPTKSVSHIFLVGMEKAELDSDPEKAKKELKEIIDEERDRFSRHKSLRKGYSTDHEEVFAGIKRRTPILRDNKKIASHMGTKDKIIFLIENEGKNREEILSKLKEAMNRAIDHRVFFSAVFRVSTKVLEKKCEVDSCDSDSRTMLKIAKRILKGAPSSIDKDGIILCMSQGKEDNNFGTYDKITYSPTNVQTAGKIPERLMELAKHESESDTVLPVNVLYHGGIHASDKGDLGKSIVSLTRENFEEKLLKEGGHTLLFVGTSRNDESVTRIVSQIETILAGAIKAGDIRFARLDIVDGFPKRVSRLRIPRYLSKHFSSKDWRHEDIFPTLVWYKDGTIDKKRTATLMTLLKEKNELELSLPKRIIRVETDPGLDDPESAPRKKTASQGEQNLAQGLSRMILNSDPKLLHGVTDYATRITSDAHVVLFVKKTKKKDDAEGEEEEEEEEEEDAKHRKDIQQVFSEMAKKLTVQGEPGLYMSELHEDVKMRPFQRQRSRSVQCRRKIEIGRVRVTSLRQAASSDDDDDDCDAALKRPWNDEDSFNRSTDGKTKIDRSISEFPPPSNRKGGRVRLRFRGGTNSTTHKRSASSGSRPSRSNKQGNIFNDRKRRGIRPPRKRVAKTTATTTGSSTSTTNSNSAVPFPPSSKSVDDAETATPSNFRGFGIGAKVVSPAAKGISPKEIKQTFVDPPETKVPAVPPSSTPPEIKSKPQKSSMKLTFHELSPSHLEFQKLLKSIPEAPDTNKCPVLAIFHSVKTGSKPATLKYLCDKNGKELNKEQLDAFLQAFQEGKLDPNLRSQTKKDLEAEIGKDLQEVPESKDGENRIMFENTGVFHATGKNLIGINKRHHCVLIAYSQADKEKEEARITLLQLATAIKAFPNMAKEVRVVGFDISANDINPHIRLKEEKEGFSVLWFKKETDYESKANPEELDAPGKDFNFEKWSKIVQNHRNPFVEIPTAKTRKILRWVLAKMERPDLVERFKKEFVRRAIRGRLIEALNRSSKDPGKQLGEIKTKIEAQEGYDIAKITNDISTTWITHLFLEEEIFRNYKEDTCSVGSNPPIDAVAIGIIRDPNFSDKKTNPGNPNEDKKHSRRVERSHRVKQDREDDLDRIIEELKHCETVEDFIGKFNITKENTSNARLSESDNFWMLQTPEEREETVSRFHQENVTFGTEPVLDVQWELEKLRRPSHRICSTDTKRKKEYKNLYSMNEDLLYLKQEPKQVSNPTFGKRSVIQNVLATFRKSKTPAIALDGEESKVEKQRSKVINQDAEYEGKVDYVSAVRLHGPHRAFSLEDKDLVYIKYKSRRALPSILELRLEPGDVVLVKPLMRFKRTSGFAERDANPGDSSHNHEVAWNSEEIRTCKDRIFKSIRLLGIRFSSHEEKLKPPPLDTPKLFFIKKNKGDQSKGDEEGYCKFSTIWDFGLYSERVLSNINKQLDMHPLDTYAGLLVHILRIPQIKANSFWAKRLLVKFRQIANMYIPRSGSRRGNSGLTDVRHIFLVELGHAAGFETVTNGHTYKIETAEKAEFDADDIKKFLEDSQGSAEENTLAGCSYQEDKNYYQWTNGSRDLRIGDEDKLVLIHSDNKYSKAIKKIVQDVAKVVKSLNKRDLKIYLINIDKCVLPIYLSSNLPVGIPPYLLRIERYRVKHYFNDKPEKKRQDGTMASQMAKSIRRESQMGETAKTPPPRETYISEKHLKIDFNSLFKFVVKDKKEINAAKRMYPKYFKRGQKKQETWQFEGDLSITRGLLCELLVDYCCEDQLKVFSDRHILSFARPGSFSIKKTSSEEFVHTWEETHAFQKMRLILRKILNSKMAKKAMSIAMMRVDVDHSSELSSEEIACLLHLVILPILTNPKDKEKELPNVISTVLRWYESDNDVHEFIGERENNFWIRSLIYVVLLAGDFHKRVTESKAKAGEALENKATEPETDEYEGMYKRITGADNVPWYQVSQLFLWLEQLANAENKAYDTSPAISFWDVFHQIWITIICPFLLPYVRFLEVWCSPEWETNWNRSLLELLLVVGSFPAFCMPLVSLGVWIATPNDTALTAVDGLGPIVVLYLFCYMSVKELLSGELKKHVPGFILDRLDQGQRRFNFSKEIIRENVSTYFNDVEILQRGDDADPANDEASWSSDSEDSDEEQQDVAINLKGARVEDVQKIHINVRDVVEKFETQMREYNKREKAEKAGCNCWCEKPMVYIYATIPALIGALCPAVSRTLLGREFLGGESKKEAIVAITWIICGFIGVLLTCLRLNEWMKTAYSALIKFQAIPAVFSSFYSVEYGFKFYIPIDTPSNLQGWMLLRSNIFEKQKEKLNKIIRVERFLNPLLILTLWFSVTMIVLAVQEDSDEETSKRSHIFNISGIYLLLIMTIYISLTLLFTAFANLLLNETVLSALNSEKFTMSSKAWKASMKNEKALPEEEEEKEEEHSARTRIQNHSDQGLYFKAWKASMKNEKEMHDKMISMTQVGLMDVMLDSARTRIQNHSDQGLYFKVFGIGITFQLLGVVASLLSSAIAAAISSQDQFVES